MRIGLRTRILGFTLLVILLTSTALTYLSYLRAYHDLEDNIGQKLQAIAINTAAQIDGDLHETIPAEKKAKSHPAFLKQRAFLNKIYKLNKLNTDLYTLRRVDGTMNFILMGGGGVYVGHTYNNEKVQAFYDYVLEKGKSTRKGLWKDDKGYWISAFAPIRNRAGKTVAVLEVDELLKTFQATLRGKVIDLMITSSFILLFSILLSFWFAKRLSSTLIQLKRSAEELSLGQLEQPIEARSNDEVGDLANALERMRESLRIARDMLDDDDDD
ncbi:MAG: HAMP domain-containing protein [Myxococcota bacterium]